MREIWMVRHGQTDMNVKGAYFGAVDVPLNETGIAQACSLATRIEWPTFDRILTSPLRRAGTTAALIRPGVAFDVEPALAERPFGTWEGMTAEEIQQSDPEGWAWWIRDWQHAQPEGGESFLAMWSRARAFLRALLASSDWERVLLVSHAGPIRCLITAALDLPPEQIWRFAPENGTLACLHVNPEGYAWLTGLNR